MPRKLIAITAVRDQNNGQVTLYGAADDGTNWMKVQPTGVWQRIEPLPQFNLPESQPVDEQ